MKREMEAMKQELRIKALQTPTGGCTNPFCGNQSSCTGCGGFFGKALGGVINAVGNVAG